MGRLLPALLCPALAGCIVPDNEIVVEGEFENRHAVRIVEPVALSTATAWDCAEAEGKTVPEGADPPPCPQSPATLPTHFLDPNDPDYQFCSCDKESGARDSNALHFFSLYAEDGDIDADGQPIDSLYGAFLLDVDPDVLTPIEGLVQYTTLLTPGNKAFEAGDYAVIGRPAPGLREFFISDDSGAVDLCNEALGDELAKGFHTLQFVVTDREWYTPFVRDSNGNIMTDASGDELVAAQQPGVPDIANSATYDVTSYTFFCRHWQGEDDSDQQCAAQCEVPEDE